MLPSSFAVTETSAKGTSYTTQASLELKAVARGSGAVYLARPQDERNREHSNGIGCHISDERSPHFGPLAGQHDAAGDNTPHKHASP